MFDVKSLLERDSPKFGDHFGLLPRLGCVAGLSARIGMVRMGGRGLNPLLILLTFIVLPILGEAAQKRVFVKQSAASSGDGSTWGKAYTELRDALAGLDEWRRERAASGNDVSRDRGEIWIAEGNYRPSATANLAGRYRSFDISDWFDFSLIGGFKGGESQIDQADPSSHITILSGDLDQDGFEEGNSFNVITAKDNVSLTISGLVIEHGNASYHTDDIPGIAKSQITNLQRARTEAALAGMIVGGASPWIRYILG